MPKEKSRRPGPGTQAAGDDAGKQIIIDDRIHIGMGMLRAKEREAVREVITSPDGMRRLVKGAQLAGSEGKLRVVDVTPGLRLIFRETPRQIRLLELISTQAFDSLDVKEPTPRQAETARRRRGVGKVIAANPR